MHLDQFRARATICYSHFSPHFDFEAMCTEYWSGLHRNEKERVSGGHLGRTLLVPGRTLAYPLVLSLSYPGLPSPYLGSPSILRARPTPRALTLLNFDILRWILHAQCPTIHCTFYSIGFCDVGLDILLLRWQGEGGRSRDTNCSCPPLFLTWQGLTSRGTGIR